MFSNKISFSSGNVLAFLEETKRRTTMLQVQKISTDQVQECKRARAWGP